MTGFLLCCGCDALRDAERVYCSNCGEATNSYKYESSEREEFELLAIQSAAFVKAVPHPVHGFLIVDADDERRAAA